MGPPPKPLHPTLKGMTRFEPLNDILPPAVIHTTIDQRIIKLFRGWSCTHVLHSIMLPLQCPKLRQSLLKSLRIQVTVIKTAPPDNMPQWTSIVPSTHHSPALSRAFIAPSSL